MTAEQALREMREHVGLPYDDAQMQAWADAIEAELKVRKLAIKDFILRWRISSGLHAQQILDELEALYQIEPSDYAEKPRFTAEEREALEEAIPLLDHYASSCPPGFSATAVRFTEAYEKAAATIRAMLGDAKP